MAYLPRSCSSRNKGLRPKTRSWASRQGINDGPTLASRSIGTFAVCVGECMYAKDQSRRKRRERQRERETGRGTRTTRRRQRRLPGGRGAVKGCDSRSRATYRTPQVQRTDREVEGAAARASRRRTSSTLSTPQGRCTPLNLT